MSAAEADARAMELLTRFGLADKRDEYPDRLSGGQQQRAAIVRALAMKPDLLLLDEITSALDPELVAEVLDVIRELAAEGMTMVIATHEMGFARDVADRVCFLDEGVILEQGPPSVMLSSPSEPRTQRFLQRIISAGTVVTCLLTGAAIHGRLHDHRRRRRGLLAPPPANTEQGRCAARTGRDRASARSSRR